MGNSNTLLRLPRGNLEVLEHIFDKQPMDGRTDDTKICLSQRTASG